MQSVLRVIIGLLLLVCALGGSFSKKHTVTLTIGDQTVSLAPGKCNVVNVDSSSGLINRRLLRTEGGAVGVQNDHVEVGRVECLSCILSMGLVMIFLSLCQQKENNETLLESAEQETLAHGITAAKNTFDGSMDTMEGG